MEDELPTQSVTEKLYGLICEDVRSRTVWDDRQATWYKMRHDGLRAQHKPWPGAADLHYPLIDTTIEKFKPFYLAQLFGTELVAQFVAQKIELQGFATEVAQWFDYKLKQQSNLEPEIHVGIDKMLMAGHEPIKVYWDAEEKRLAFDAVEPIHCIVPDQTECPKDADRITFVHHFTPDGFKRDPRFKAKVAELGDDFVQRITGQGAQSSSDYGRLDQIKDIREGITHAGKDSDIVIVWEVWENTVEDGWWIHYFSPLAPEEPVRVSQRNPFHHEECPVVRFDCEIKDKGWYASRGIPEKLAPFEQSLCKMWNDKHNAMTVFNRPMFSATAPIPNASNLKLHPGQILPYGVQAVTMGRPPVSFDEEMNSMAGVAERLIGVPDYGIGEGNDKNDARTATEVTRIGQQQSSGIQLRSKVFLMALRKLLGLAWETLIQYDKDTVYFVGEQMKTLPQQALDLDGWSLMPNASSETWDRNAEFQKALALYQLFGPNQGNPQGSPYIKQAPLVQQVLENNDPRKVALMFQDPMQGEQNEYEDEVVKIPALMEGAPLAPKPNENQAVRIKAVTDFIASRDHLGIQLTPIQLQGLQGRVQANMAMLQQKNPQEAAQVQQGLMQQAAQNVVPMQPQGDPLQAPANPAPMEGAQ